MKKDIYYISPILLGAIVLMVITFRSTFEYNFWGNLVSVPIWALGCFMTSGAALILPTFLIDYGLNFISNKFENYTKKQKITAIVVISVAFIIGIPIIVEVI